MSRILRISILFILWSLSTLFMFNLPNYIVDNASYATLSWLIWTVGFGVAFVKAGL